MGLKKEWEWFYRINTKTGLITFFLSLLKSLHLTLLNSIAGKKIQLWHEKKGKGSCTVHLCLLYKAIVEIWRKCLLLLFWLFWVWIFAHSKDPNVRTYSEVPACWWTSILFQGNREAVLATHIFGKVSVCCNLTLTAIHISPAFINAKPQKCLEGPECSLFVLCICGILAASL